MRSGDSDGSNSDPEDRTKQEYALSLRFMNAVQRKLDQIQMRQSEPLSAETGPTNLSGLSLGEAERRKLLEINNRNLLEGVVAGAVSFMVLRRIRSGLMHRMINAKNAAMESHTPTGAAPTGMPGSSLPHAPKSPFQQIKKPPDGATAEGASSTTSSSTATPPPGGGGAGGLPSQEQLAQDFADKRTKGISGTLFSVFGLLIDGAVSFYIAVFVSIRNPGEIINELAKLPLIEGRSRVAEEFCPEFLHELQAVQKEVLETNNTVEAEVLQNPQSLTLKGLLQFCHNCQLRAAYEQQLRQQLGLSNSDPVSIPSPGVPETTDTPLFPDFAAGSMSESGGESANDFYDPRDEENDWADPFVTDQEEQSKNERDRKR